MIRKHYGSLLGSNTNGNSADLDQTLMSSTGGGSVMGGGFLPSLVDNPFSSETLK